MHQTHPIRAALRAAFPPTIPILTGYLFLGMTYGIYMKVSGFGLLHTLVMSVAVYAGSMQFVAVDLLMNDFRPADALLLTLMMGARHLFYGLSMLDRYRGTGWKKPYLIFGLTDESFSITCTAEPPAGVDRSWFVFFVTLLDQIYWVTGAMLGCLTGGLLTFNTEGLDFVMTAMFVVILLEQLQKRQNRLPALIGLGLSAVCLALFGADGFMIPAMLAILGVLLLCQRPFEQAEVGGART